VRLRSDQSTALKNTVAGFKTGSRGQILAPCGWGKSAVQPKIAKAINARTSVVFVPSLRLVTQTAAFWLANAQFKFETLLVCSKADKRTDEDVPDFEGFNITTDPDEIASFLRKKGKRVLFCTYHSAHKLQDCSRIDLGIFDEAHHTAGLDDKSWGLGLHDHGLSIKKRLFMTATPRIVESETDQEVVSMDDKKIYGPIFYEMSFKEAVKRDIVVPYKVIVMASAPPEAVKGLKGTKDEAARMRIEVGIHILEKARKKYGLKRTLSFHSRVSRAQFFADRGKQLCYGDWHCVSAKSSLEHRAEGERILESKAGGVVSNCRCLAEGIDIRDIDSVVFLDPRYSIIDIIQSIGRAMRLPNKHPKKVAHIIVPVVLTGDEVEDLTGSFAGVSRALSAIAAIDEPLTDYLLIKEEAYPKSSGVGQDEPIILDIPNDVSSTLAEGIRIKVLRAAGLIWEEHLDFLKQFVLTNNRYPNIRSTDAKESVSGSWVNTQRSHYKSSKFTLSPNQISALESLPNWSWSLRDRQLELNNKRASDLLEYFKHNKAWPNTKTYLGGFREKLLRKSKPPRISGPLAADLRAMGFYENQKHQESGRSLHQLLAYLDEFKSRPASGTKEWQTLLSVRNGSYKSHPDLVAKVNSFSMLTGTEERRRSNASGHNTLFIGRFISFIKRHKEMPTTKADKPLYSGIRHRKSAWTKDPKVYGPLIVQLETVCSTHVEGYIEGKTMFDKKTLTAARKAATE
jgi:superfamily II DNA or RNA helicase